MPSGALAIQGLPEEGLSFLKPPDKETNIPIPSPDFLRKIYKKPTEGGQGTGELVKYEREYDAYCHWAALPHEVRKPKNQQLFEKKWNLPKNYLAKFHQREGFQEKRLGYFWEWMMDKFPNVVYAIYQRAMGKSSKDANIFVDLISKYISPERPRVQVSPMILVGVPQEKIDKLFIPEGYENIQDITPKP